MKVRQLERILAMHGAPASFLDTVTRSLRAEGRLPIGGRGVNAPDIGPDEAAWVMIGLAATDVAAQAALRFALQLELALPEGASPRHARNFVDAVQALLGSPETAWEVWEIRVGRSHNFSQIVYRDGHVEPFVLPNVPLSKATSVGSMAFRSEGIISGGLLHQVAIDLSEPQNLVGLVD
ncbi:hypothetical protein [Sphingosinicella sp. LY1275]|uniref:hypothetical protein n=1 Tax=Sphingosinicella sp. LY1275 TaxID=3095379 RepID=UPI002ADEFC2B|nr:hypothetical protein [Sphingosinicella sp. LY1275]MEA1015576.1 hypothetical protein [Sphingosinicella sp. LY1275]